MNDREIIETLLTEYEWDYLYEVIDPYRKYVETIWKTPPYLCIHISKGCIGWEIKLPIEVEREMFKNLETDCRYTLEDLGL